MWKVSSWMRMVLYHMSPVIWLSFCLEVVDAGLVVLVSFISPFISERRMARELFEMDEFIEVFVDTPIEECERRDVKGLYIKARRGELKNFTGIDSPYEAPEAPEVRVFTSARSPEDCVQDIKRWMERQ